MGQGSGVIVRVQSWEGTSEQKEQSMGRHVGMKHHDVMGQLLLHPFVGPHCARKG